MSVLNGRIALVTGAESGIGAACARALGKAGAAVGVLYFHDEAAATATCEAVKAAGSKAVTVQADVSDEKQVDAAFSTVEQTLGKVDILVNSAGLNQSGVRVVDMGLEQWSRMLRTDLTGPFLTCRRYLRGLGGGPGAIVNISSIHDHAARAGAADYDAAKGGLENLTTTLALECASLGVTVNAIAPGMILTPMNARAVADATYRAGLEASIPLGRAGKAEEVADLCVYLASPAAGYITGANLVIDGGLSLVLGQGA